MNIKIGDKFQNLAFGFVFNVVWVYKSDVLVRVDGGANCVYTKDELLNSLRFKYISNKKEKQNHPMTTIFR